MTSGTLPKAQVEAMRRAISSYAAGCGLSVQGYADVLGMRIARDLPAAVREGAPDYIGDDLDAACRALAEVRCAFGLEPSPDRVPGFYARGDNGTPSEYAAGWGV